MSAHPEHDRLQTYLDGECNVERARELESRLQAEPDLATALIYLAREETICKEWASVTVVAKQETTSRRTSFASGIRRRSITLRWVALGLIAVCVALLVLGGISRPHRESPSMQPALASVEEIQGLVEIISPEGNIQFAKLGQFLLAGQEIRTGEPGSSITVRYPQSSRLMLGSETHIRLESDTAAPKGTTTKVYVVEGVVSAEVPVNGSGNQLFLHNELAELHATAGRYSFASLPEGAFLETDSGHGTFIRKADRSVLDVPGGQFAIASMNEPFRARRTPIRLSAPRRTIVDGTGPVLGLSFEPEGSAITSFTSDGARRWELNSGKLLRTIRAGAPSRHSIEKPRPQKDPLHPSAWSLDGSLMAFVPEERLVRLFDGATGNDRGTYRLTKRITAVALAPDGRTLAAALTNSKDVPEIRIFDTVFGLERTILTGQNGQISCMVFSPSGEYLATASSDRSIKIWQVHNVALLRSFGKSSLEPRALAFSPDDRVLAVGERKGSIRILDVDSGAQRYLLAGHLRDVWSVAFSPDGRLLLSGAADNTARLWDLREGRETSTFRISAGIVSSVTFSQDGQLLATGTWDKKILLWNVPPLTHE